MKTEYVNFFFTLLQEMEAAAAAGANDFITSSAISSVRLREGRQRVSVSTTASRGVRERGREGNRGDLHSMLNCKTPNVPFKSEAGGALEASSGSAVIGEVSNPLILVFVCIVPVWFHFFACFIASVC